jgi:hypothetical protein
MIWDDRQRRMLCFAALTAALTRDSASVGKLLARIADHGPDQVFASCRTFATMMLALPGYRPPCPHAVVGIQLRDPDTGQPVSVDEAGLAPDLVAAMRICAMLANDDLDTAKAVFTAAYQGGHGIETAASVLALTTKALEHALGFAPNRGPW